MPRTALAVLLLLAGSWAAQAQVPAGQEFLVNTYTTSTQDAPAVCHDAAGDFVVVWQSLNDGAYTAHISAQRFSAAGAALGGELRVDAPEDTYGGSDSGVACSGSGGFVVVWNGPRANTSEFSGILARRFDASGAALGSELLVNTYTTGLQLEAAVAGNADGSCVVAWESLEPNGIFFDIFGQRYDAGGQPRGAEFRVNTVTYSSQTHPALAMAPDGAFVVAWTSYIPLFSNEIHAQRYDAAGAAQGGEFAVNASPSFIQDSPAAAMDAQGSFTIVWESFDANDSNPDVFGQRFDAAGTRQGGEFRANSTTTSFQERPSVAANERGDVVVAWRSLGQDGDGRGVYARRFDAEGNARGGELRVNTYTTGDQDLPAVSADAAGNLVVSWASAGQDGSFPAVMGQRFGGLLPTALGVDSAGNHILEPGETAEVRPSWRNVNGSAQAFAGALSNLTGPAGATYTITDGAAGYGTVASGATVPCADCYAVSVSSPPARPATHWDATALESITPDAQGQRKVWRLHVGQSFADVPAGAFYPFVETLLHHGITGGCSATAYCPAAATTREQMAVFVLVAKEGPRFAPPSCTSPVFNDVPAGSPFCRWVEELARRGVATGCGGGNYCPADAVTREQMAVFVLRTLDPALSPPACTTPVFGDVPAGSPFCRWVEELFRRGVVTGCGGGNYCPQAPVTREQMAVFIAGTFGLTLYGV